MKKLFCGMLALSLCLLSACKGANESVARSSDNYPTPNISASQLQSTLIDSQPPISEPMQSTESIDVDLTKLSSTMVYSEVYNMMYAPDSYIGKTVKMQGQFAIYQAVDESGNIASDKIYFACVIADAAACCSQGLEFVLAGEHDYPNDYPEPGSEITVIGTFQTYDESGVLYCHLVNASIVS